MSHWIMHIPSIYLLTLMLLSNNSFCYHPANILLMNSQTLSLGIVFDNFPLFFRISRHFVLVSTSPDASE